MNETSDIFSVWLRELVVRNRWLLLGLIVAGGIAGATYPGLAGPRYRATWMARVGRIAGVGEIEPPGVAAARLDEWLRDSAQAGRCRWQTSFVEPPESTVHLTIACPAPDETLPLATAATEHLLERHQQTYAAALAHADAYPSLVRAELGRLGSGNVPAKSSVKAVQDMIRELNCIDQTRMLSPSYPTEVIERARQPGASTPSRLTMGCAGGLLGALLGLALGALRMAAPRGG